MNLRNTLTAGALALTAVFPAFAAEAELDTVVVTASRQPQRMNELLSDVSVISREEIESAGQASLPELLARQPGIEYTQSGGAGSAMGLFIRGTNSEHTLVLIDGMRVNSATLGTTSLSRIPLSQIDHIEILRGPASSLYGSEAIGGVIQIFTKQGKGPMAFNAEVAYGTDNTSKVSAGVSGQANGFRYSLQASYDETDGFSNIRNKNNYYYNRDKDGFRDSSFTSNLAYSFSKDHEVGLNTFTSNGRNHYDGGAAHDDWSDERVSRYSLYSRNRWLPAWQSTLRVGRGTDDLDNFTDKTKNSKIRTDQDQISWQNDIKLPLGNALLAAEEVKQKVDASTNYDKTDRTIKSLLAGWSASAGSHRWQFNTRYDDISETGSKTTGTAAYGYQFNDAWRASASYGTAYKAPTMNDLYYPLDSWGFKGNPDLKPEFAHNREVSLHYETARHTASITYFHNRIEDLIQWAPGSMYYEPQNVSSARITGWSLAYKGFFGPFTARASVDLQDPRVQKDPSNPNNDNNILPRRARKHASLGLDYTAATWTLGGEAVSSGKRYNDPANKVRMGGYTLFNVAGSYRLSQDVSLFVRIDNLFDKKYELVSDYGTPGLTALVGIRYQSK